MSRRLALARLGRIAPGFAADLVLLDLAQPIYVPLRHPVRQLVHGENGAAVENDEQFIEAAVQLAADDARRRELGSSAARAMKRLHPQQVVAEFDALLAELAQSRRSGHAHYAA